jgi:uncharacterized HhH-GPD family protein
MKQDPSHTQSTKKIVEALLKHGADVVETFGGPVRFTTDEAANRLLFDDPFAFLIGVICDQGIRAEKAWAVPYELQQRLGTLSTSWIGSHEQEVLAAFATPPKLHRYVNNVAHWVVNAARKVEVAYGGDASEIWSGEPRAETLRHQLESFLGIGQKKAAMAVEILARDMGVAMHDLSGSDVAYDVHLRRVFLRTGLASRDERNHMVDIARNIFPERPGLLDFPVWDIGRRWCRPTLPSCDECPLSGICPRHF